MITISRILGFLNETGIEYNFQGNPKTEILGFSSLSNYRPETFTWCKNSSFLPSGISPSKFRLIITSFDIEGVQNIIITQSPKSVFFAIIEQFFRNKKEEKPPIGFNTYISPSVKLGKNVLVGHNCSLDGVITIGDDTIIGNNVSIVGNVVIGTRCEIQSGCIIGYENIAYSEDENHVKTIIRQYGGVTIGNDVKIQASVKIACGAIDNTVIDNKAIIGDGSTISHNCYVGENVAMLPFGILCGSVYIGKNSYISASMIKNQIHIGENAYVGFGSVVVKDVADNEEVWGNPARRFPLSRR